MGGSEESRKEANIGRKNKELEGRGIFWRIHLEKKIIMKLTEKDSPATVASAQYVDI